MAIGILNPIPQFFDIDGSPLDEGKLWFGPVNNNPVVVQTTVFWDAAATIPAAQPIRTINGYPVRGGKPAVIYANGNVSLLVQNRRGRQVFYAPDSADFGNASTLVAQLNAYITLLASSAGPASLGFLATYSYPAFTVGAAIQDGMVNVMWFLTDAERTQVRTNGTTIDLTSKINAAKSFGGNRPLKLSAGTWSFTSLDFRGNTGGIVGDGIGNTLLKCRSAVARALDFNDTTDVNPRGGILKGFTLEGDGVALGIGIDKRYRHQFWMESLYVRGFTGAGGVGIKQLDTYTCHEQNVRTAANGIGRWLVGSNHASTHKGGGSDTNTVCNLLIETNGTPADGNEALVFEGFVTQSAVGTATNIDITCSSASFNGCYFGENGATKEAITLRGGNVMVDGGTLFVGFSATTYGVKPLGGRAVFRGPKINGQTFAGIDMLIGGTTNGKVAFYDVAGGLIVSGNKVFDGDPLDYGPQGVVYCKRLGKSFTNYVVAATASTALVGNNARSVTCLTAPGPSPFVGLSTPLVGNADWRDGELLSLILVYSSNTALEVRLSGAVGAGAPSSSVGNPPATGGAIKTFVKLDFAAASTAWTLLELYKFSGVAGDTFTLYECILSDSRTLNKLTSQFGNLSK